MKKVLQLKLHNEIKGSELICACVDFWCLLCQNHQHPSFLHIFWWNYVLSILLWLFSLLCPKQVSWTQETHPISKIKQNFYYIRNQLFPASLIRNTGNLSQKIEYCITMIVLLLIYWSIILILVCPKQGQKTK